MKDLIVPGMSSTFSIDDHLSINRLGYGAMQLTGYGVFGDVQDRTNAINLLKVALQGGVNFIDTAEAYGPHFNESLISDALYPYDKKLIIATKGGFRRNGPNQWTVDGTPEFISKNIEGSLKRLKTNSIELWQLHRIDPKVPVKETLAPVLDAVRSGKIKHVGLSEVSVQQIEQVREILPVVSVQNLYNLGNRQWENVLDYTEKNNMAFIPWFPLASGPSKLAAKIKNVAERHHATTAQIALAWLLMRAPNILLIPGTQSIEHLKENMAAADIRLTPEEFSEISH